MEKKLFSIGELSRIKGITRKALRFYERIGLLKPYYVDPRNRYRYYASEQFISIDIIKALRLMDISPLDIKTVFKKRDTRAALSFLDSQKAKAAHRIEELRQVIESIARVQNLLDNSLASVAHKDVYRRKIPERTIVTLPFKALTSSEQAVIEFSRFDRLLAEHKLLNAYETGILFESAANNFVPASIFNTVNLAEHSDASVVSTLPAGEYICVCYNPENASAQSAKISRYCQKHRLQPTLLLQVELLNDIFSMDSNYVELEMLVR